MKKRLEVNGEKVRREREKRAWTQEELCEKAALGVRTLRRLEAGYATLETVKRVNRALQDEPAVEVPQEPAPSSLEAYRNQLNFDPITLRLAPDLIPLAGSLRDRIPAIRRHLASTLGIVIPGVRLCDSSQLAPGQYCILIRETEVASAFVRPDQLLAIGSDLPGEVTPDPTYGMPAVWIEKERQSEFQALQAMIFDCVSVIATHLTERIRSFAHRLLGIEEVHQLLGNLGHPKLREVALPRPDCLVKLRSVLRDLLEEQVPIRDLVQILETLADHPDSPVEEVCERVRHQLAPTICQDYANCDKVLTVLALQDSDLPDEALRARLEPRLEEFARRGLQPLVVAPDAQRRAVRRLLGHRKALVVMARGEVVAPYQWTELP